tara:strand:- start:685 stop:1593 length:909 start_codon:yes stop_codon:yes gene_type:complete
MSEVVNFPFENPLVGQIESVDLTMCETIVSLQRNQTFFHKIVNLASRTFRARQKSEEEYWFDFIKVHLKVPSETSFIMVIDEMPEDQVCVPLGLLLQVTEFSGTSLPFSIVSDVANGSVEGEKRGLMYDWVHTDTKEAARALLQVGVDVDTQNPNGYFNSQQARVISKDKIENVALLTEAVTSKLKEWQNEQFKRSLIISALRTTVLLSTNEYSLADEFEEIKNEELNSDTVSDDYENFDLVELWNWMIEHLEFTGFIGSFQDFVGYSRSFVQDEVFAQEEEESWLWLNTVFLNTEEEDLHQ